MRKLTVGAAVFKVLVLAVQLLPVEQVAVEAVSQSRANFGVQVLAAEYPGLQSQVWGGPGGRDWRPQPLPQSGFETEQTLQADPGR